jgi:hypothetical protein
VDFQLKNSNKIGEKSEEDRGWVVSKYANCGYAKVKNGNKIWGKSRKK